MEILRFEKEGNFDIIAGNEKINLSLEDVEIVSEDIPGWLVANEGNITVALDIHLDDELKNEGIARELVNRIQNIRKESGFDVTDKIEVIFEKHEAIAEAVSVHQEYIGSQTLAQSIELVEKLDGNQSKKIDLEDDLIIKIKINRI